MIRFKDLLRRLGQSRRWIAAQFGLTLLLILIGLAWTRLPDRHLWQVALTLLLPLLLAISALELQAGTMRRLADDDGKRVKLVWGAMTLLVWIAVVWVSWAILDWCDGQFGNWSSYLDSQASEHWRARLFTYEHIQHSLSILEWVLRWIVVPAKVIPYAIASAQWGWRLPWRCVLRLLWNGQWWLAVVLAAMLAVWLPDLFFAGVPHGTVSAQVWHVSLKLAATYLLAVSSWVLLLGWAAVLFGRQKPLPESDDVTELVKRLTLSRRWIAAQFGWVMLFMATNRVIANLLPDDSAVQTILSFALGTVLYIAGLVVQAGMVRSQLNEDAKQVRIYWGTFSLLIWVVLGLGIAFALSLWYTPIAPLVVGWLVMPAILLPFAAASAVWGVRLPWKRILRVQSTWRWWLAVLLSVLAIGLVHLLVTGVVATETWIAELKLDVANLLQLGIWVLLLGWLAVLFGHTAPPSGEALAEVPALVGPPEPSQESSVKLPLPEDS